jgi:hypothetical protein
MFDLPLPLLYFLLFVVVILSIAAYAFSWFLHDCLKRIPEEHHTFPIKRVWYFLIPFVGLIMQWMILPYAIPKTLRKAFPNDPVMEKKTRNLYEYGLVLVAFWTVIFVVPYDHYIVLVALSGVSGIFWAAYWVEMAEIKKRYLMH